MCGRFALALLPARLRDYIGLEAIPPYVARYNIAPTMPVLALRVQEGSREAALLRWGLVPAWSKGPDNRYSMINARAETVATKPAYRNAFEHRRCLIPADGFFEWQRREESKTKQPYFIARADGAPMAFAGLWERWQGDDVIESCTIIVTDANDQMKPIHDRMPALLAQEDWDQWLDPLCGDQKRLQSLLRPSAVPLELRPVSPRVNSPRNDGPALLEPLVDAGLVGRSDALDLG